MFRFFKQALVSITWSERPVSVSPALRDTHFAAGRHVQQLWLDESLRHGPAGRTFVGLGSVDTDFPWDESRYRDLWNGRIYNPKDCSGLFEHCLALPPISDFRQPDLDEDLLRLDLVITEMKPGSRLSTAPFGFGHAWVQIEGRLSRQLDDTALLEFVHRRRSSGLSSELRKPDVPAEWRDLSDSLVGQLLRQMSYDILMELDHRLNRSE